MTKYLICVFLLGCGAAAVTPTETYTDPEPIELEPIEVEVVLVMPEDDRGLTAVDAEGTEIGLVVSVRNGEFVQVLADDYIFEVSMSTGFVIAQLPQVWEIYGDADCTTLVQETLCRGTSLRQVWSHTASNDGSVEVELLTLGPVSEGTTWVSSGSCVGSGAGCYAELYPAELRSSWVAPITLE